jgi:hypothetical protein
MSGLLLVLGFGCLGYFLGSVTVLGAMPTMMAGFGVGCILWWCIANNSKRNP